MFPARGPLIPFPLGLASESLCPSDPTSGYAALDVSTEPSEGLSPTLFHASCPGPHVPLGGAGVGVSF